MKNYWFAALLCIVFAFAATGCGTPRAGGEKRRYTTAQTGTNIPRWQTDAGAGREARAKQRAAKPKRDKRKREKPKRERQERRSRAADDEVITRGGFR